MAYEKGVTQNYRRALLRLCYLSFGLIGFIFSMRTNVFLYVQSAYLDGYDHIATLVLLSGILMQLSLYITGHLIERAGHGRVLLWGTLAFAVPVFLFGFVRSVLFFDVLFSLLMLGYGIAVLVLNLFVSHLVPERKGNVLLMLHLFFALGALAGPKWISFLVDRGLPWQYGLAISSLPLFVTAYFVYRLKRVIGHSPDGDAGEEGEPEPEKAGKGGATAAVLFIVIFLCSQTWEYGMGTWFVIFAHDTGGLSASGAANYLTLFYGAYPLVRILFSRIIHRLNLLAVLFFAFASCGVFIMLGNRTGQFLFYSMSGLGVALMYPGIMASMQDRFGRGSTRTIGFITMAGGLIQYLAIWAVGLVSSRRGIQRGFSSLFWYMAAGALAVLAVSLIAGKRRKSLFRPQETS